MAKLNYGQVSVTGTATVILAAGPRRNLTIKNIDAANFIRVGDASVGAATGYELGPKESITLSAVEGIAVYGIAVTSNCNVTYLEEANS